MARNTRAARAAELEQMLQRGPSFTTSGMSSEKAAGAEAALELTRVWLRTWIAPAVHDLVPELRK
jgi:hypothetical protein